MEWMKKAHYACHGFLNGNILSKVDVENKAAKYSSIDKYWEICNFIHPNSQPESSKSGIAEPPVIVTIKPTQAHECQWNK